MLKKSHFYFSTGKYVCHHPILKFSQHYQIGGRDFKNIEAAVLFYRTNPLGDAVLTEQVTVGVSCGEKY